MKSEVNEVIARGPTAAVRLDLAENLQDLMVLPQSPQKSGSVGKAILQQGRKRLGSVLVNYSEIWWFVMQVIQMLNQPLFEQEETNGTE